MFVDLVLGERLAGLLIKLQVVPHATQGTQSFYFDFFVAMKQNNDQKQLEEGESLLGLQVPLHH